MKCCLPFVTSILILCVHNSFFVCLLAEWYRVIFTLCFHFFSLCYDSMFIFIAHSLLLLFSFIAAAVDDDVVVAFSLTHTRCRITFHTMYSHCANFFYPSRTRLAYTHKHSNVLNVFLCMFLLQNRVTRISWRDEWMRLYNYGKKNEHKQKNRQQQFYICVFVYTWTTTAAAMITKWADWVGSAIRYPYAFGSLVFAFGLHKNNWPLFHSLSCVCLFFSALNLRLKSSKA